MINNIKQFKRIVPFFYLSELLPYDLSKDPCAEESIGENSWPGFVSSQSIWIIATNTQFVRAERSTVPDDSDFDWAAYGTSAALLDYRANARYAAY